MFNVVRYNLNGSFARVGDKIGCEINLSWDERWSVKDMGINRP